LGEGGNRSSGARSRRMGYLQARIHPHRRAARAKKPRTLEREDWSRQELERVCSSGRTGGGGGLFWGTQVQAKGTQDRARVSQVKKGARKTNS